MNTILKSKYQFFSQWKRDNPSAYAAAKRLNLIEEICLIFGWDKKFNYSKEKHEESWNKNYLILKKYLKHNDYLSSTAVYKETRIGIWCNIQRYKFKNKTLSKEYINLLESLRGWKWKWSSKKHWNDNYKLTKEYLLIHKKTPSKSVLYKNSFIGIWCWRQKENKKNKIGYSYEQLDMLNSLKYWKW